MSEKSRIITWIIILIGLLYCMWSCSPVQRLNRFHKKHPYLFEVKTDTILHRDTIQVFIPAIELDTVVHYTALVDTVVIEKEGITTMVWQKGDTVYVQTNSEPIYINVPYEVKVPYTKYVAEPKTKTFAEKLEVMIVACMWIIFIGAVIYIIYHWFKNR